MSDSDRVSDYKDLYNELGVPSLSLIEKHSSVIQ